MADKLIRGIKRRATGWESDSASGSHYVMNRMLAEHGLPEATASYDRKLIALQAELFELIERWSDVGEAGLDREMAFISRQIRGVLDRLKRHCGLV